MSDWVCIQLFHLQYCPWASYSATSQLRFLISPPHKATVNVNELTVAITASYKCHGRHNKQSLSTPQWLLHLRFKNRKTSTSQEAA